MKKIAIFMLAFIIIFKPSVVKAADISLLKQAKVVFVIESYDKTLLNTVTTGYTYLDALNNGAKENGIEIFYTYGDGQAIHSVNDIKADKFGAECGWFGYVIRKGNLIKPVDFLNFQLETNDQVVLYYGHKDKTKIASSFSFVQSKNIVTFTASFQNTLWVNKDEKWISENSVELLEDMKIKIKMPNDSVKVLKTNKAGQATTQFEMTGVYGYHGEGYVSGSYPIFVRTMDYVYLNGIKDEKRVTKGEAAAFLVNTFKIKKTDNIKEFSDVNVNTPNYKEITTAASAGLIHGNSHGEFSPDSEITLLQLAIMLSGINLKDSKNDGGTLSLDVAPWAYESVKTAINTGLLNGIYKNWESSVSAQNLMQIYNNNKN